MLIYRNAEGVHGQRKFGNPCLRVIVFLLRSLAELNHNRSPHVSDSDNDICCHHTS